MFFNHLIKHISAVFVTTIFSASTLSANDNIRSVEVIQAQSSSDVSSTKKLTGTVTSPRSSDLSSRMEGLITEVNVDAGSVVKKGDLLVQLDAKLAELDLALIKTEIAQAEIELIDAKRLVAESTKLTQSGAFAKSETATRKTMLLVSENKLKQLDARQSQLLEKIARHQLIAPFDGVISSKLSEAGEWVATGNPVLRLIEMSNLRFDLQVPQESLAIVKNTGSIKVLLDAYPNQEIEAKVSVIVPVKNNISRTFLTRLTLTDPDGLATPGMSGTATIESHSKSDTIAQVPRDALVKFPDGTNKVWIVENGNSAPKVVSKIVKTAGELGKMAKIIEGLKGGETIVIKGNEGLQENQAVKILNLETSQLNAP
jgi:RND family efflux transporter MFP subunit